MQDTCNRQDVKCSVSGKDHKDWYFYQNGKNYYIICHRYRHYLCASKFLVFMRCKNWLNQIG